MAGTRDMVEAATRSIERLIDYAPQKLAIAGPIAGLSAVFHWAVTPSFIQCAVLFLVADWLTGTIKGFALRQANSDAGVRGIIKSLIYLSILGLAINLSLAIPIPIVNSADEFVAIVIIVNEGLSILENYIAIDDHYGLNLPVLSQIATVGRRYLKERLDSVAKVSPNPAAPSNPVQTQGGQDA